MKFIIVILFLLFLPLLGFSQVSKSAPERDAFSGTWVLNSKKSSENSVGENVKWRIGVTGDEFRIHKTYTVGSKPYEYEMTLFSDSRGEKNVVLLPNLPSETIFSKTKWDKNNLVRRYKTASNPAPLFVIELTEKYSLSKGGGQLTVESRVISTNFPDLTNQINRPHKSVFEREK